MTDILIQKLISQGLTKAQATSRTAEVVVDTLIQQDGKILVAEANNQVREMSELVKRLKKEYDALQYAIEENCKILKSIYEVQNDYGEVGDARAKTVIALYASLLNLNSKYCRDGGQIIENAGYVTYAYLGGQAKREVSYSEKNEKQYS